jgi:P27 family predicted phage terminase small subunit
MPASIGDELHHIKGTRPTRAAAPQGFAGGKPSKPPNMSPVADKQWDYMVKTLGPRGRSILTKQDGPALQVYCECFARWQECLKDVATNGVMVSTTVMDSNGEAYTKRVLNPAARMAAQLDARLQSMLASFSATPASRERVKKVTSPPPRGAAPQPGSVAYALLEEEQEQANKPKPKSATAGHEFDDVGADLG